MILTSLVIIFSMLKKFQSLCRIIIIFYRGDNQHFVPNILTLEKDKFRLIDGDEMIKFLPATNKVKSL